MQVMAEKFVRESDLAALAKKVRIEAGKSRAQAARDLGITNPSLFNAEEVPEKSLTKLRCRIIEAYSSKKVVGPFYRLVESKK
jgi:hypothetical protein